VEGDEGAISAFWLRRVAISSFTASKPTFPLFTLTTILCASFLSRSRKNLIPSTPPSAPFFLFCAGLASTSETAQYWNW